MSKPLDLLTSDASADAPPAALLPYQQRWVADTSDLKIAEKGRRTGFTWGEAADNVLIAAKAGGSNVFYISATEDMAREYIEAVAMWSRVFDRGAAEISDGIYDDGANVDPEKRYIKKFEVNFPKSGRRIVALSSRPQNLRGKQGVIVIDEAAFQNDLAGLIKAAMAMLLWGDKVRIISTHNGVENPFNELIEQVRAGKRGKSASVHTVRFRDAVNEGLYQRVCLRRSRAYSKEDEAKWLAEAYASYGDDSAEELDAVPSQSGGAYLTLAQIEARMSADTPLIRERWDDSFALLPKAIRTMEVAAWCDEVLGPILATLRKDRKHVVGEDFGRVSDLTVLCLGEERQDLVRRVRLVLELANCPFEHQKQIFFYILERTPRLRSGAMDATGNGAYLAEVCALRFGTQRIEQVKLSESFYQLNMPKLKAGLQDATIDGVPRDESLRDDLRAIRVINGVPKLPPTKTSKGEDGPKLKRHGDFAIALLMMAYASIREAGEIDYEAAPAKASRWGDSARDDDDGMDSFKDGTW